MPLFVTTPLFRPASHWEIGNLVLHDNRRALRAIWPNCFTGIPGHTAIRIVRNVLNETPRVTGFPSPSPYRIASFERATNPAHPYVVGIGIDDAAGEHLLSSPCDVGLLC